MSTDSSLQAALRDLESAFPPHPLDPENAFAEWGGTYLGADDFKAGVRGRQWSTLPSTFLEFHHDAVHFLGPSSFADYLPAYLSAAVRRDKELDQLPRYLLSALTRSDEHAGVERFDARIARLRADQQRAIARALEVLEASHEISNNRRDVAETMDSYWRDLIERDSEK